MFVGHCVHFLHYVNDDAYITFRYARALADGKGPYWNPEERVEGYSNPLQMLLAAGAITAAGADRAPDLIKRSGMVWGLLALSASAWTAFRLGRSLGAGWGPALAAASCGAALAAVAPGLALNAVSGLETALYAALLAAMVAGMTLPDDHRWRHLGWIAAMAACWTRPEAPAPVALCLIGAAIAALRSPQRRLGRVSREALAVGGALALLLALRILLYDGELLPNTYQAKAGGFWGFDSGRYVWHGSGRPLLGWPGLLAAAAGLLMAVRPGKRTGSTPGGHSDSMLPLLFTALGGTLLPFVIGADWMLGWRLVAPYLPLAAATAALGWLLLIQRLPATVRTPAAGLLLLLPVYGWFAQEEPRERLHQRSSVRAQGYVNGHTALAEWVRSRGASGDTVALMDIGIVGYRCPDQKILDLTGLTDRFIANSPGPFLDKQYDPAYVFDRSPEWIVLTLSSTEDLAGEALVRAPLRPWTGIEGRLAAAPEFSGYRRPRPHPGPGAGWQEALAARLGAERVFEHDYPRRPYLLALFRRQATSTPAPGSSGTPRP
ncbi:hypothetical protein ABI59_00035 [Acidobacteria bacterium Mor1]|nr:hypothetical protein ABI59_00035 [Acidobacteria bacterium Mor1]